MKIYKIKNPCENFNLEAKEDGINYYCLECEKNVKDLTLSDVHDLSQNIHNEINSCVKINKNQLFSINNLINTSKVSALASLIALAASSCSHNTIVNNGDHRGKIMYNKKVKDVRLHQIKGKIIDISDRTPLIGCPVEIKGTGIQVLTDVDGNFKLEIPQDIKDEDFVLFSYTGYLEVKVELHKIRGKEIVVLMGLGPLIIGYLELQEF